MKRFWIIAWLTTSVVLATVTGGYAADTSRVYVQFKTGQKDAAKGLVGQAGGQIHYEFDSLNALATTVPEAALAGIRNNPNVVLVEDDPPRYLYGQTTPYGVDMVRAPAAVTAGADGSGITVGVIDSGLYRSHEDFSGVVIDGYPKTTTTTVRIKGKLTTETKTLSEADEEYWGRDYLGHGTHVSGTIAAAANDLGVVGVSPGKVNIYMVKVFGDTGNWVYSSTLLDAAQKAQQGGAKIISMSLGGGAPSSTEQNGLNLLYSQGVLLVAAAGNSGSTSYSYPASYDSVISVAAIDSSKTVADFSQKNSQVELAAPGVGVLSTIPYATPKVTVGGTDYSAGQVQYAATGVANGGLVDGGLALSAPTDGSWNGKVVLVERGDITFNEKVQNVQNAGGVAAVIYNNVPGGFSGTLGTGNSSAIPAVSITQEDGQTLLTMTATGKPTTTVNSPEAGTIGSGYAYYDGTSMATPHVSGVAALIWSKYPAASAAQVREALVVGAEDVGDPGRDMSYGYGLVRADSALTELATLVNGGGGSGPIVSITGPANNAIFGSGATITFSGTATDSQNNDVSQLLVWTANGSWIGNGGSFSTTLPDGSYYVLAMATDANGTGSDSVNITVGSSPPPPPPPTHQLNVVVSTDKGSYVKNQTAIITASVKDENNSSVDGAAVHLDITTGNGGHLAGDATTGTDGKATFTYRVNSNRDGTGTYQADASATKSGYTSGTGGTTFQVN